MTRYRQTYTDRQAIRTPGYSQSTTDRSQANIDAFAKACPELATWLERNHLTNDFAASLRQSIARYGSLTERQAAAVQRSVDREAAAAQPASPSYIRPVVRVMLPGIVAAFTAAQASGEVRRPKLRLVADELEITLQLAPETGSNPGFIYVKRTGEYVGKISPRGEWFPGREATDRLTAALQSVDANPMAAAREYARFTAERDGNVGSCCCCGRLLTNPESVRLGIGPICGGRWGWL